MAVKREAIASYLRDTDAWDLIVDLTTMRVDQLHASLRDSKDWDDFKFTSGELAGVEFLKNMLEDLADQHTIEE